MEGVSLASVLNMLPIGNMLWAVLSVALFLFAVHSALLFWHWRLYSTGKFTTLGNMLLYVSVGAGLLFVMGACVVWFMLSV